MLTVELSGVNSIEGKGPLTYKSQFKMSFQYKAPILPSVVIEPVREKLPVQKAEQGSAVTNTLYFVCCFADAGDTLSVRAMRPNKVAALERNNLTLPIDDGRLRGSTRPSSNRSPCNLSVAYTVRACQSRSRSPRLAYEPLPPRPRPLGRQRIEPIRQ